LEHHHHRFLFFSLVAVLLGGLIAGGGYWAYWNFYERFRPVTIAKNQVEIQRLLDEGDWVAPGRNGPPLYLVSFRDCTDCITYQRDEFPKLAAANIDTRVIVFARPDHEGLSQSTAAERATIAELWVNRDWTLYSRWMATTHKDWTASDLKAADHDFARTAVVNASRDYVTQLSGLLKGAGIEDSYPIMIWRDRDGFLKACNCTDERSFHFIRTDLGAPGKAQALVNTIETWRDTVLNKVGAKTDAKKPASKTVTPAPAAAPATTTPAPATAAPAPAAAAPVQGAALASPPPATKGAQPSFY
jgi:hypothetical protein